MGEGKAGRNAGQQPQPELNEWNNAGSANTAEGRVTLSEAHYRMVVESASDFAIITSDLGGEITSWNPGAEKLLGWSEADALGRNACMIFTPEDLAGGECEREMGIARERGRAEDERWHLRSDGSRFWASGLLMRFEDENTGEHIGYLKILRDRTVQHQGNERLGESEARFRNMADHAPVIMWVTDPNGTCTYLNRRWYEFTGQTEAEAVGYGWLNATHPDDKAATERVFHDANTRHAEFRAEYRLRHADGSYRWAIDTASPRFGEDGTFLGYIGSVIDIDERREAENAIRRTGDLLSAVMGAVPGVVYAKDREGRMLAANRGTAELVGKPITEILGRTDREFLDDPVQAEAVMANDRRIMAENRTEVLEEEVSYPDGTRATWLSTKSPFRDPHGAVVGLVGSSLDISERKRAEEQLQESQARLSEERTRLLTLLDNLPVGVCFISPAGEALLSNPAFRRFLPDGPMPSKLPDSDQTWFAWDENGERLQRDRYPSARTLRGEVAPGTEFLHRAPTGQKTWLRFSGVPIRDADGDVTAALLVLDDINEQKLAQQALQHLNETLEGQVAERTVERDRVWRTSRDLLVIIDKGGLFHRVNPAWTKILGWTDGELLGRPLFDFIHPDDITATNEALAVATAGPLPSVENRYRHKDGSLRWISWVAAPEGEFIYANGRDVTAEKERELELEAAQEQLRQSQKMEAVGQLTGGIAHDFNNLLTGVIGSLDMMQRRLAKGETDRIERYATTAITAANRAAALTHRLLAFARRQPLDPKPVNANRLVTGMEELLRRTIGEAISLEIVTAGGLWQTLCDPHQLESAILNLAINARDAMPSGGKLTIETCNARLDDAYAAKQREVKPGQYVCVCVTDTGTGMTADVIAKAFEPFFTTKPIGQGTGLGLSMIYGFARQSEGYAKIYSEEGTGTTVKLYLPRYYGEAEDAEADRGELTEAHRTADGEVVLVVEDEAAVRDLVVDVLEELGYRAIEAADGPTGLKLLQSNMTLDLLISDVGLPGLNGRQLADAARKHRPGLKVLFMTGYAENATIANGFLEPGMEMITKPFAIEALATRIRDMIEEDRG